MDLSFLAINKTSYNFAARKAAVSTNTGSRHTPMRTHYNTPLLGCKCRVDGNFNKIYFFCGINKTICLFSAFFREDRSYFPGSVVKCRKVSADCRAGRRWPQKNAFRGVRLQAANVFPGRMPGTENKEERLWSSPFVRWA
jgi:hypothetical protein